MPLLIRLKHCCITLLLMTALSTTGARAAVDATTLDADISALVIQGNAVLAGINGATLSAQDMSTQLGDIETSLGAYQSQVNAVYASVTASQGGSLGVTNEMMTGLQALAGVNAALANANLGLSRQIRQLAGISSPATLESSLSAMLRLSDDIGEMANRILEMADKILIMADNIGLMADRIIATQIIQSNNLALVVDANLQTQTNAITLIKLFSDSTVLPCCVSW